MKTKHTLLCIFAFIAFALIAVRINLPAQTTGDTSAIYNLSATVSSPPVFITTAETIAAPFIVTFAQTHPWLVTVLTAMAAIGSVAKPLVTAVEIYVRNTPSPADDAAVAKAEASLGFKIGAWLLDFFTRIKIGPQFTATPKN